MLGLKRLTWFSVSASLFVSLSTVPTSTLATEATWPYDLPPHVKHFPGDERLVQKKLEVQEKLATQRPLGLLKMNPKECEMFFPEYWQFDADGDAGSAASADNETLNSGLWRPGKEGKAPPEWEISTSADLLEAPLKLHQLHRIQPVRPPPAFNWLPRLPRGLFSALDKREFQCPGDTLSCTGIDRPNSCCPIGGTCQLIPYGEQGDVGCCREGQTCSQQAAGCLSGYTSCPVSSGGGCCIPGYDCVDVGCALISTAIVVVTPTVIISPFSTSRALQLPTTSSSATLSISSNFASNTPSSTFPVPITTTAPSSSTSSSVSCSSGFRTCAPSFGGGCCPSDRECGSSLCSAPSTEPISSSSSINPNFFVPVRPTSNGVATITSASVATPAVDICPTGFYQCSAYYHGGCCRVGRDCSFTSCPTSASTTVANSNGVVILGVVSSATGSALGTGSCAQGWYNCAEGNGGGCCPSGYACGQSCTATVTEATATAAAVTQKIPTSGAFTSRGWKWQGRVSLICSTLGLFSSLWVFQ